MAKTSWSDGPLLTGAPRAYKDHGAKQIVVETTKENPAGSGLEVCRLALDRAGEARAILALPDLLKDAEPFAALGRALEEGDANAPLIMAPTVKLEGDVQRIAAACARAFPPAQMIPPGARIKRGSSPGFKPKGRTV